MSGKQINTTSGDKSSVEVNAVEAVVKLYEESCTAGRHHERQCSIATQCVLVLAAAALGLLRIHEATFVADISISGLIIAIGICGARLTRAHCESIRGCFEEQRYYVKRITKYISETGFFSGSEKEIYLRERSTFRWVTIHWVVAIIGLALAVVTIVRKFYLCDRVPWF